MVRAPRATHYEPITWDDAFALIGETLRGLDSPDEAIFYTSGKTSNEAAFAYQLFARAFGTNNLPDCSNMCHESTSVALAETIGIGKGSVSLDDVHHAELIVISGQNPGTNHPRMLTALEMAKQNGAKILAINPLPEAGLMRFKNPQTVARPDRASAPASPTCTCRSGSTATWRCGRRSALLLLEADEAPARRCSTATSSSGTPTGFEDWAAHIARPRLGRASSARPGSTGRRSARPPRC